MEAGIQQLERYDAMAAGHKANFAEAARSNREKALSSLIELFTNLMQGGSSKYAASAQGLQSVGGQAQNLGRYPVSAGGATAFQYDRQRAEQSADAAAGGASVRQRLYEHVWHVGIGGFNTPNRPSDCWQIRSNGNGRHSLWRFPARIFAGEKNCGATGATDRG